MVINKAIGLWDEIKLLVAAVGVLSGVAYAGFVIASFYVTNEARAQTHDEKINSIQTIVEQLVDGQLTLQKILGRQATAAEARQMQIEELCRRDQLKDRSQCPNYQLMEPAR